MALDMYTLFSLPQSSNGFVVTPSAALADTGSASPPRKIARLDADSDSASAYRSRPAVGHQPGDHKYAISVVVSGALSKLDLFTRSHAVFT